MYKIVSSWTWYRLRTQTLSPQHSLSYPPPLTYTYLKIREFANLLNINCCRTVFLFGHLSVCPPALVTVITSLQEVWAEVSFKLWGFCYCCEVKLFFEITRQIIGKLWWGQIFAFNSDTHRFLHWFCIFWVFFFFLLSFPWWHHKIFSPTYIKGTLSKGMFATSAFPFLSQCTFTFADLTPWKRDKIIQHR